MNTRHANYLSMAVAAALLLTTTWHRTAAQSDIPSQVAAKTVSLTIDYGDGSQKRFPNIAWPIKQKQDDPVTVADVLAFAERHDRGIKLKTRGKGETQFLEAIDGLTGEGAGGRNWMFLVDGELAQASYATTVVEPGADILWEFRKFQ